MLTCITMNNVNNGWIFQHEPGGGWGWGVGGVCGLEDNVVILWLVLRYRTSHRLGSIIQWNLSNQDLYIKETSLIRTSN